MVILVLERIGLKYMVWLTVARMHGPLRRGTFAEGGAHGYVY